MTEEATLPPVRCSRPDCGAVMDLTPNGYLLCPANISHGRRLCCPKEQRTAWRAEKRKVQLEIELTILPVATRLVYQVATEGNPGRYLHCILGASGIWLQGSGTGAVKASYGGKKCSFVRAAKEIEEAFRVALAGPLKEALDKEKDLDNAGPEA